MKYFTVFSKNGFVSRVLISWVTLGQEKLILKVNPDFFHTTFKWNLNSILSTFYFNSCLLDRWFVLYYYSCFILFLILTLSILKLCFVKKLLAFSIIYWFTLNQHERYLRNTLWLVVRSDVYNTDGAWSQKESHRTTKFFLFIILFQS